MTGVGVIGYAVNGGGISEMVRELRKHLGIQKHFAIPHDGFDPPFDLEGAQDCFLSGCPQDGDPLDLKAYQWEIQRDQLEAWVVSESIKTVVTVESPFGESTVKWLREMNVRVVLIVMPEFFDISMPAYQNVSLYLCPSFRAYQEVPADNKIFIPWPIDDEAIAFKQRSGSAKLFLHVAGMGGMNNRKGTPETIAGFLRAATRNPEIKLLIRAQRPLEDILHGSVFLKTEEERRIFQERVEVRVGTVPTVSALYDEGDALICCHRLDGHNLMALESAAAGLPVLVTDSSPMNEQFKGDYPLLVKVAERRPAGLINKNYDAVIVDVDDLAAKILWAATNDIGPLSKEYRTIIERNYAWRVLRARWEAALKNI